MVVCSRPTHRVFINFRGKDLRFGFASHLTDALERNNIKFFIDTHELKGRDLKYLFKRIKEATIALVILSTRYAESKWCLEELSAIMEQAEKGEMFVIPIFYKVKPEDVRRQKGQFGSKFWRQMRVSTREEMEKWQMALKAVSNKIGFILDNNRSEAKFIKNVVEEVGKVLITTNLFDEPREEEYVKTYHTQVSTRRLFGSLVVLLAALLLGFKLLADKVHKSPLPAIVALVGLVGVISMSKLRTKRFNLSSNSIPLILYSKPISHTSCHDLYLFCNAD